MTGNDRSGPDASSHESKGGFIGGRPTIPDRPDVDDAESEADRSASADDEAASTADQMAAREDQLASDRDQAIADRQHDAAPNVTATEERAYADSRAERSAVSQGRKRGQDRRKYTAGLRRATATLRDRITRPRIRSAAIRKRLIAEGETAEIAARWCDAWEGEAKRQGVSHDVDYWSRGTQWIWAERAAGTRP
jgi:hypothetical protein